MCLHDKSKEKRIYFLYFCLPLSISNNVFWILFSERLRLERLPEGLDGDGDGGDATQPLQGVDPPHSRSPSPPAEMLITCPSPTTKVKPTNLSGFIRSGKVKEKRRAYIQVYESLGMLIKSWERLGKFGNFRIFLALKKPTLCLNGFLYTNIRYSKIW